MTTPYNEDFFISRLHKCKQVKPNNWKARCPAHEDKNPSLSLRWTGEKMLVKCHTGCSYESVMAALGTSRPVANSRHKPAKPKPRKRMAATYDYTDEAGQFLFQKVRFEPKSFAVRHKAGREWRWGIGDNRRVLYRLPEVAKTERYDVVYVVEGEKDADRLAADGLVATCNFDGASKEGQSPKWRPDEYNTHLTGKTVYIVPDNDEPGMAHARHIANSLHGVAQAVKVVELPGLGTHQDVSDWLDMGNTVTALDKHCLLTDIWQPTQEEETKPEINTKYPKTQDYLAGFKLAGYEFRLNELDDSVEANNEPLTDTTAAIILNKMRDLGLNQTGWVERAWRGAAATSRYHPVKDYLNGLKWDGKDHIGRLVNEYLTETTGMGVVAFKRWLVGAVAKVFEGGQNFMLVWDSEQGVGKSFLSRWLCPLPGYFIEGAINPEDKDSLLRLCTNLVWEVGELQATTRKSDREALKDFISKQMVTVRRSYGHFDLVKPALSSLIGTVNEDGAGFLTDPTGSRRFVIIRIEKINWQYSHEMKSADLWAQAVALYKRGEPWQLTPEEKQRQSEINAEYETDSMVAILFFEHYRIDRNSGSYETIADIMSTLESSGLKGNQRANMMELARLMKRLKCDTIRPTLGNRRPRSYRHVTMV